MTADRRATRTARPRLRTVTALVALLGVGVTAGVVAAPAFATEHGDAITALTVPGAQLTSNGGAVGMAVSSATVQLAADDALAAAERALAKADKVTAAVAASDLDLGPAPTWMGTMALRADAEALRDLDDIAPLLRAVVVQETHARAGVVAEAATDVRERLTAAEEKQAAAEEAARARAAANTVSGAKATARRMAADRYGWGSGQFSCLVSLWNRESGWNYQAYNSSSGATGIPQALPGSKMASAGSDWRTNATTQISWGLDYIARAYGSPCGAWSHSQGTGWY